MNKEWQRIVAAGPARHPNPFAGALAGVGWRWASKKPLYTEGRRKTFLHISLGRLDYGDATAAERALSTFLEKADPDFGHSYAWDYVVADGRYLWHLGAQCLWSRANFEKLVANLVGEALGGRTPKAGMAAYCTCGSGCRRH